MTTYRVYTLDTTVALAPAVHITYVSTPKYAEAWQGSRHALSGGDKAIPMYVGPDLKEKAPRRVGDNFTVSKITVLDEPKKAKIDVAQLKAILEDPKASDSDKLKATAALLS